MLTGVSQGLGRALTAGFINAGHVVIGCCRSVEQTRILQAEFGERHSFDVVDVSDDQAVKAWAIQTLSRYGPPDLLLNNAAIINPNAKLWNIDAVSLNHLLAVNISGTANVIRHFVPAMIQHHASSNQTAVIVNVSSGWGRSVAAEVAPYCASKWAIEGLTLALAQELPRGFCAVPLNPGIINTPMLQSCFASGAEFYPSAADWAQRAVPFILSLDERHNGQQLSVPE